MFLLCGKLPELLHEKELKISIVLMAPLVMQALIGYIVVAIFDRMFIYDLSCMKKTYICSVINCEIKLKVISVITFINFAINCKSYFT